MIPGLRRGRRSRSRPMISVVHRTTHTDRSALVIRVLALTALTWLLVGAPSGTAAADACAYASTGPDGGGIAAVAVAGDGAVARRRHTVRCPAPTPTHPALPADAHADPAAAPDPLRRRPSRHRRHRLRPPTLRSPHLRRLRRPPPPPPAPRRTRAAAARSGPGTETHAEARTDAERASRARAGARRLSGVPHPAAQAPAPRRSVTGLVHPAHHRARGARRRRAAAPPLTPGGTPCRNGLFSPSRWRPPASWSSPSTLVRHRRRPRGRGPLRDPGRHRVHDDDDRRGVRHRPRSGHRRCLGGPRRRPGPGAAGGAGPARDLASGSGSTRPTSATASAAMSTPTSSYVVTTEWKDMAEHGAA